MLMFPCALGQANLHSVPSVYPSLLQVLVASIIMSPALLSSLMCVSFTCAVGTHLGLNSSSEGIALGVSVVGVYVAASEFRLFLWCHLGPASSLFSYLVFLYRKYLGYSKKFLDMQRSRRIRCGEETVNRSKFRVCPVSEGEVKEYGMEEMYHVRLTELFPNMMESNRVN